MAVRLEVVPHIADDMTAIFERFALKMWDAQHQVAAHTRERCAKLVPTNWLDPALTHMLGKKISARDVEKVMRSVKAAIHKMED